VDTTGSPAHPVTNSSGKSWQLPGWKAQGGSDTGWPAKSTSLAVTANGVRVVSTELKTPELEQKLLARIRQFDFGAKDVDMMVVSWPVDFLPS